MDRDSLLADVRAARELLESALAGLGDEAMTERVNGDWTRKDVIAHLEGWEARTVRLFAILRGEREFDPDEPGDTDGFNAWWFERNRGRPLADVRRTEREAYEAVIGLVTSADDADLFDPTRFEFLEGQAFEAVVRENSSGHYPDHLGQLSVSAA
ncbi:MAG TPA: ClbS/DfsB family four-helix bundle protein [Candidatus Limnocylindrales bacterium]